KQHENGRRFSGAVRAEKAEDLALVDAEGKAVDGDQVAIPFGEILCLDYRHYRRPRRQNTTASPSTTAATIPAPTHPHSVAVDTVTRKSTDLFASALLAATVIA